MARVQLEVITLAEGVSHSNSFTVLLQEKGGKRRFVIVIGYSEAQSIAISLDDSLKPTRPLTHDLFKQVCGVYSIQVLEVAITKLVEGIYYANIVCKKGDLIVDLDSRSSDALAIALRFKCPIYISEDLLNKINIDYSGDAKQTIEEFEEELEEELRDLENISLEELEQERKEGFKKNTLKELEEMLHRAIENEDYELAASIRDEIEQRQ